MPLGRLALPGKQGLQRRGNNRRQKDFLSKPGLLRNLGRLFERPDNPFRRAWLLPYAVQRLEHRALVVLFLLAAPLLLARGAGVAVIPFALLYGHLYDFQHENSFHRLEV